jgi:tetratricopeptide (TPR) repeat protein
MSVLASESSAMSNDTVAHLWLRGGTQADRQAAIAALDLPSELVPALDAHRRLRGPYTAAGSLCRALVPGLLDSHPDVARRNDVELLTAAPELRAVMECTRETLNSVAIPAERTRFHARLRTIRLAHGMVEFLRDTLPAQRRCLVVTNVDEADPTDAEFLAVLLRRIGADRLTVVCASATEPAHDMLAAALRAHADVVDVPASGVRAPLPADPAWAYVSGECLSDDPRLVKAYEAMEPAARAQLHERRAAALAERDEKSLTLGAIPYHLEHGTDPAGAGRTAVHAAQDYCVCLGFYDACVELGRRYEALAGAADDLRTWFLSVSKTALSLAIMNRSGEAEEILDDIRLHCTDPEMHMSAAYSTGMLYTRHYEDDKKDSRIAKAWCNNAIALASRHPDPIERAFFSAFNKNGLALVEVNLGDLREALRLVTECIDSLDELLEPDEHKPHRSVLKNNRARVYSGLGMLQESLADYAVAIAADPNHPEHYLERGGLYRRMGRLDDAFADYETAVRLSPPFPELHYNRADLRAFVGDLEGALAEFGYVLELDPEFVDAYVNRAALRLEVGDPEGAAEDVAAGLARQPDNPHLLVTLGQIHAEHQEFPAAREAFDRALAIDPDLVTALSSRAALAYDLGELAGAIDDLCHAVELRPDDAALRYNRAFAYQDSDRWQDALADLDIAARLAPDDEDIAAARQTCLTHVGPAAAVV